MSKDNLTPDKKIFETYGKALEYCRNIRDLSQGDFAKEVDIHQSQVSRWENSDSVPIKATREKIEQVLNYSITLVAHGWSVQKFNDTHYKPNLLFEGHDKIASFERQVTLSIAAEPLPDDPVQLIELAESILRLARLKMKS